MTLVRIQSSFLLNDRFELPTKGLERAVKAYQKAWGKVGSKIIRGLERVTGLTFFPNVIQSPDKRAYKICSCFRCQ